MFSEQIFPALAEKRADVLVRLDDHPLVRTDQDAVDGEIQQTAIPTLAHDHVFFRPPPLRIALIDQVHMRSLEL